MKTVREVSRLTGVSVRTLHHYDAIGLLRPTAVTAAGYRLYDDAAMARLQSILLFRELHFPLREIKTMLDSPDFDSHAALTTQIGLLEAQKKHIEGLIVYAHGLLEKGENEMSFEAFDKSEIENYKAEAKERWGGSEAYREYEHREEGGSIPAGAGEGLMAIFASLGTLRGLPPESKAVQAKIDELQQYITDNYYACTPEILLGLGQMYTADERFRRSIDSAGGEGTAALAAEAIRVRGKRAAQ